MIKETSAHRVLVIADTHNKLPEIVRDLAREANEIWHLGDLCSPAILDELNLLGPPVTFVRGNCDSSFEWPLSIDVTRDGKRFRLQHVPLPRRKFPTDCDVFLHGHTHVPRDETIGGVRFLNPGCVTRPNRGAPPSVAWLEIGRRSLSWTLVRLR
jgi:uncharacterized protein